MRTNDSAFGAGLLCLIAAACTPTGSGSAWDEPDWGPPPVEDVAVPDDTDQCIKPPVFEDWPTTPGGPLSGYFAVEATVRAKVVIAKVESKQTLMLKIHQDGTRLRQRVTLCNVALPSFEGLAELIIPAKTQAVLESKIQDAEGEFLSSTAGGATYAPGPQMVVVGKDGADDDCDDNPGVSVEADVILCEEKPQSLYLSLTVSVDLNGTVANDFGSIEGTVTPILDWTILGSSDECLKPAEAISLEIEDNNTFRALRVDGKTAGAPNLDTDENGEVSCQEIMARTDLFPVEEEPESSE